MADQLQTNYASDLRSILKTLFEVMATKPETDDKEKLKKGECSCRTGSEALANHCVHCPQEGSMQKLTPPPGSAGPSVPGCRLGEMSV